MKVKLAYGKEGLEVDLPGDRITVIEPHYIPGLADEQAAIREALSSPIGCPRLRDMVRPDQTVAITFPDVTRPCPTARMLPALLEELAHLAPEQVVLLSGTGMHRPNTEEELIRMVGEGVYRKYRVINHDAFDPSTLALVGKTGRGTDIWVSREYLQADVKVLVGFIEPHMFAGFSGGGKAVLPGIAGEATVLANHDAEMIGDPRATFGVTRGNPIFEEIREAALLTRPSFLMNVTLNREKAITACYFGEMVAAHNRGIDFARRTAMRPVPRPFDVVVTTNSGYPLDLNLYQSTKGICAASMIARDGGAVVCAAECSEGIPEHGNYRRMLRSRGSLEGLLEMVMAPGFSMFDQWAVQIQAAIQMRVDVSLYSSMADDEVKNAHLRPIRDVGEEVRRLLDHYGPEATVAVLPEGLQTIPYVRDEAGVAYEALAHGVATT